MQTRLRFQLILSGNRSTKDANVRIWVDADEDGNMENSEQIGGVVSSGKSWRGSTEISRADAKGVPFLVRFHASPGTRWRLRVQSDRPRRHVVYEQSDRTQRAEERIIGWCGD